jgi:curved DNA-binding protein CbpA
MLESQGSRPLDPYRTLQLHPRAPRQLIVEAYWHLVSRRKLRGEAGSISDLNAAYGLLMDEVRRAGYDAEHGLSGAEVHGQLRHGSGAPDYYERLRVDPDADGEIIELAHEVLARESVGQARESLDEAHRTLGNPQLRAQYDSSVERSSSHAAAVPVVAPPCAPAHAEAVPQMFRREEARVSEAPGSERREEPAARPVRPARETPPPSRHGLLGRLGLGRGSDPVMRPTHGEPRRFASDQALDAAKDERLLALHGEPLEETEAAISAPPGPGNSDGLAALVFLSGPFAGLRVGLGSEVVTIGSAADADVVLTDPADRIAPEHARIWQHGEHFVFRQFEGARTVIGGQRLMTSMVILDDGDEIQIGPHRITFTHVETTPA